MTKSVNAGNADLHLNLIDYISSKLPALESRLKSTGANIAKLGAGIAGSASFGLGMFTAASKSFFEYISSKLPALELRLKSTGANIAKLGAGIAGSVSVGLGMFTAASKSFADAGTSISDLATKTGVATTTLSELEYVATKVGASMDDVQTVIKAVKDGKSLELWASKSSGVLALLTRDVSKLRQEARNLGLSIDPKDAAAAVELANALRTSGFIVAAIWREIGAAVGPAATESAKALTAIVAPIIQFIRTNREMVRVLFIGLGAIASIGTALASFGAMVAGAGAAIGFLAGSFGPLLAITTILAGIGVAAYNFRDVLSAAFRSIRQSFAPAIDGVMQLYQIFSSTFGTILALLGSGRFEQAANIAWLGMVAAAWTGVELLAGAVDAGIEYLRGWIPGIDSVTDYFRQAFGGLYDAVMAGRWDLAGEILMAKLQLVWTNGIDFLKDGWDLFVFALKSAFSGVADFISNVWHGAVDGIARGVMWIMEKTGMAAEGSMAMLEKMQAMEAKSRQQQSNNREDPAAQMHARMMAREQSRNAQRARIAQLERQAAEASAAVGSPEVAARSSAAREALRAAIKRAESDLEERGNSAPGKDVSGPLSSVKSSTKTEGTFSAAAAAVIGSSGNEARETAMNTRMMARTMIRVADNTARNGAVA